VLNQMGDSVSVIVRISIDSGLFRSETPMLGPLHGHSLERGIYLFT
jgi:hypothetical protein